MGLPEELNLNLLGTCPVPQAQYDRILLGHGSGGRLTSDLIQKLFVPAFRNDVLGALEDQATIRLNGEFGTNGPRLALTTDSFVVRPIFFRAETSGDWRCMARSMTWRLAALGRCSSPPHSFSRKVSRSRT